MSEIKFDINEFDDVTLICKSDEGEDDLLIMKLASYGALSIYTLRSEATTVFLPAKVCDSIRDFARKHSANIQL